MKKNLVMMLALALTVTTAACGGKEAPTPSDSAEKDPVKVVYVGTLGDNSFHDSAWKGLERARDELGIEVALIEPATAADYGTSVVSAVNSGADMVLIFGGAYADTFNEYCQRFPEVYFGGLNSVSATPADNLVMASVDDHEGSFLAGALAAMASETGTVGAIGGAETDAINRFIVGYEEGVHYVDPEATVLKSYVGSWDDPATAKEFALQMYKEGADVIYQIAGGSGMGVIEAAQETDGLYAIGVDADQDGIAPGNVLTSMVKRCDNVAYDFAKMVAEGNFQNGIIKYGVSNGGVSLTEFAHSRDVVTDEMIETLAGIQEKIASGEIKVTDLFEQG